MKTILKMATSIGLLALALWLLDVNAILDMLWKVSGDLFVWAIAINILAFTIMGVRWYLLSAIKLDTSLLSQLAVYFKATFLNTFTPANLGGDAYRLVVLKNGGVTSGSLFQLLLRERLLGLYGFVIVFALAYTFLALVGSGGALTAENPFLYGVGVAIVLFGLPFLVRPLGGYMLAMLTFMISKERLSRLVMWVDALSSLLSPKGSLWLMSLTFVGILLWVFSIQVIANGFGLTVPILHLAAVATMVELIRLIPVTVQGIGLREGAFAYLLSFFGHNPEQCYVIGLAAYLALSVSIVLCGPIGQVLTWVNTRKKLR